MLSYLLPPVALGRAGKPNSAILLSIIWPPFFLPVLFLYNRCHSLADFKRMFPLTPLGLILACIGLWVLTGWIADSTINYAQRKAARDGRLTEREIANGVAAGILIAGFIIGFFYLLLVNIR